jgi:hypothetical protein
MVEVAAQPGFSITARKPVLAAPSSVQREFT